MVCMIEIDSTVFVTFVLCSAVLIWLIGEVVTRRGVVWGNGAWLLSLLVLMLGLLTAAPKNVIVILMAVLGGIFVGGGVALAASLRAEPVDEPEADGRPASECVIDADYDVLEGRVR